MSHIKLLLNRQSGSFPGEKQSVCEVYIPLQSYVEVKNEWSYTPTPQIRLHGVHIDKLYLFPSSSDACSSRHQQYQKDILLPVNASVQPLISHTGSCAKRFQTADCFWNVLEHVQTPDFVFRRNGRVHFNRPGGVSSVDYWQPRCAHQRQ